MAQMLNFKSSYFENAVREVLNIFDRPIFLEDAEKITQLDLSEFTFQNEDFATLIKFKELRSLDITTSAVKLNFLKSFRYLENLYIEAHNEYNIVGFNDFKNSHNLKSLTVSGGTWSWIQFLYLEDLLPLKFLKNLSLHEFGFVNLSPLASCTQLESFYCGYGKRVVNISAIKNFSSLKSLSLLGLELKNLDFLEAFPDDLELELCGLKITEKMSIDKLSRFTNADISEITVCGKMIIGSDGKIIETP